MAGDRMRSRAPGACRLRVRIGRGGRTQGDGGSLELAGDRRRAAGADARGPRFPQLSLHSLRKTCLTGAGTPVAVAAPAVSLSYQDHSELSISDPGLSSPSHSRLVVRIDGKLARGGHSDRSIALQFSVSGARAQGGPPSLLSGETSRRTRPDGGRGRAANPGRVDRADTLPNRLRVGSRRPTAAVRFAVY